MSSSDPDPRFDPPVFAPPVILVVSGPSGVGKTVLCDRLVVEDPSLVHSISATTRAPRAEEVEGRDYLFRDEPGFRRGIDAGEFLEWAEVHGHLYGTPRAPIESLQARGLTPVLNVDVQGGRSVKSLVPDAVLVYLMPPSLPALAERLRRRGSDPEETIRRRLMAAAVELGGWEDYDYAVINDDLDASVARVQAILLAERHRVPRLRAHVIPGSGGG